MAQVTFCDSASHPHQVNQSLWKVEPRNLVFKCFLSDCSGQASLRSPVTFRPERLGSGEKRGTRLIPDLTKWSEVLPSASRPSWPHPSKGFSSSIWRLLLSSFHLSC